ncbi:MAG: SHOCT domain-containing protein [Thiomonas sp.]
MMWFHPMGFGGYGGGMGFGWIFMLLLVAVVVVLLFGVLRQFSDDRRERRMLRRGARDILDERYSKGEIDADEYKRRRADIES